MKKWMVIGVCVLTAVSMLVMASPVSACVEGFTPGYWKNVRMHPWPEEYNPGDCFCLTFGVPEAQMPAKYDGCPTLMEALKQGGGGLYAFSRQAVAQLLNVWNMDTDDGTKQGHEDWLVGLVQLAFANPASITYSDNDFVMHTEDVEWWKNYIESYHY